MRIKSLNEMIQCVKKFDIQSSKIEDYTEIFNYFHDVVNDIHHVANESLDKTVDDISLVSDEIKNAIELISAKKINIDSFDLTEILKQSVNSINSSIKDDIEINDNYIDNMVVRSSKSIVFQICVNLIKNACESLLIADVTNKVIDISITRDTSSIYVTVNDNGSGFSKEKHLKVFNRYSSKGKNRGVGLNFCKNFAHHLGGHLEAESPGEGLGATFKLSLPIVNVDVKN